MLAASAERIHRRVAETEVVLDIGGWADPFPRADWVLDAMPYSTRGLYEREGWIDPRRPEAERFDVSRWIQRDMCDREPFPFDDRAIDFVICSQTLEDVRDPVWVCREMQRIGKAGYIEVPSRLEEQSFGVQGPYVGWPHHHWLIDLAGGSLEFVFKPHDIHVRTDCHFPLGFHEQLSAEDRVLTLWWQGALSARERVFIDESPYDHYLPSFVATGLERRPVSPPRARRGIRRLGRKLRS